MLNTAIAGKGFYHLMAALVVGSLFQQMPRMADAQLYNFQIGYTQCYSCQAGTFIGTEGSGECIACQPGYYQDSNGSSVCSECPEGLILFSSCAFQSEYQIDFTDKQAPTTQGLNV